MYDTQIDCAKRILRAQWEWTNNKATWTGYSYLKARVNVNNNPEQ